MVACLPIFSAALWWGSLTALGFVAVPLLFMYLPSKALAGSTAAHLFAAQTYIAMACCALLLVLSRQKHAENPAPWAQKSLIFIIVGLLLALLLQYGVAPRIVARDNLRLWHSVGTALYFAQWLCAAATLWKVAK